MRSDGRLNTQLRPMKFTPHYLNHHRGSVLVECGRTKILVAASVENRVPPHLLGTNQGWLTAEYNMLPCSTDQRKARPGAKGPDGRSIEIQRLIGRSLRQAVRLNKLGQRTITIDCDVIEADGGTRTTAITGGFVALALCLLELETSTSLRLENILTAQVAAVSLGVTGSQILTDLCYQEDVIAGADVNLVMQKPNQIVEFQGSAENQPVGANLLACVFEQGQMAIAEIFEKQREALGFSERFDYL